MTFDDTGVPTGLGFTGGKWEAFVERYNGGSPTRLGTNQETTNDGDANYAVTVNIGQTAGNNWGVQIINGIGPTLSARVWIKYRTFLLSNFSP